MTPNPPENRPENRPEDQDENQDERRDEREAVAGDLEYDLAQESATSHDTGARRRPVTHVVQLPQDEPGEDGSTGGDYGYDLARDVPRSR